MVDRQHYIFSASSSYSHAQKRKKQFYCLLKSKIYRAIEHTILGFNPCPKIKSDLTHFLNIIIYLQPIFLNLISFKLFLRKLKQSVCSWLFGVLENFGTEKWDFLEKLWIAKIKKGPIHKQKLQLFILHKSMELNMKYF